MQQKGNQIFYSGTNTTTNGWEMIKKYTREYRIYYCQGIFTDPENGLNDI
jgi:hypothetical protein